MEKPSCGSSPLQEHYWLLKNIYDQSYGFKQLLYCRRFCTFDLWETLVVHLSFARKGQALLTSLHLCYILSNQFTSAIESFVKFPFVPIVVWPV